MPVEDLNGLGVTLHGPVVDSGLSDQSNGVDSDPLPEDDILGHDVVLHLGLEVEVEDLELLSSG